MCRMYINTQSRCSTTEAAHDFMSVKIYAHIHVYTLNTNTRTHTHTCVGCVSIPRAAAERLPEAARHIRRRRGVASQERCQIS